MLQSKCRTAKMKFIALALSLACVPLLGRLAEADTLKVVFPTTATTLALPYYVASKMGWLENLTIEEIYVTGDANASRVLLSKQADIGIIGTLNALLAASQSGAIKAINSWQPRIDFNLIARKDGVASVVQLPGKTFAATGPGGLPDQLIRLLCPKYKISCSDIRFISVSGGHPALLQAVLGDRADAALVNTLTALKGEETGEIKTIERIAEDMPSMSYIYTVVRSDDIENPTKAAQFQIFTDAMIKGSRYIMQHPEEAASILHTRLRDFENPFLVDVITALNKSKVWGFDGGLNAADVRSTIDLLVESGGLPSAVKSESVTDLRFVTEAAARLGQYNAK